ncbi:MAG: glycoside hydrolase [Spirosomaceae bacterium]|nr:glycoside hydrolase [Spirosomataceae bacterium]
MKHLLVFLPALFWGFMPQNNAQPISNPNLTGTTPRLSTDHRGNPVLSWAEKDGDKSYFFFAVSTDDGQTFGPKVKVNAPTDFSVHAEGMPKVAFKADGTIVATFERRRPTKEAPRAGDLLYSFSKDNGNTWSQPAFVHRDATAGKGHSFSDIARLPNGELGIVWLDEKMGDYEGRSVKFVQTLPQGGFSNEVVVDSNACQCCRTVLFIDNKNHLHVTYRDLAADNIRDMAHAVSTNGGKTFSNPRSVYPDGWQVAACPHTGPSMAQVGNDLFVSWFSGTSAQHQSGVRVAQMGGDSLFTHHLTIRAKHPQLLSYRENLVVVWDESMEKEGRFFTKIGLRVLDKKGKILSTSYLTPDFENATYPVLLATKQGLLLAYESKKENQNMVIMKHQITLSEEGSLANE